MTRNDPMKSPDVPCMPHDSTQPQTVQRYKHFVNMNLVLVTDTQSSFNEVAH